ncbi:cytosolic protein [Gracilibacillus sp. YIM 98692]|uniref:cytosolic protein n=1 Tax=Gracilibacillus sp. YIM 98692 TaxID=2663532 RepID=UPI0013D61EDF|nr:cytosolic protein [Gracilibacillus sp. YIM 98692]
MSIRNAINKNFNNHSETRDKHWDPALRTHYFKTTKDKAFDKLQPLFQNSKECDIVAVSKEHGEISLNYKAGRKVFVIMTIIMVKPYRTAIDISATTESAIPFDFGYSHKLIPKLYDKIKKELDYIGTTE